MRSLLSSKNDNFSIFHLKIIKSYRNPNLYFILYSTSSSFSFLLLHSLQKSNSFQNQYNHKNSISFPPSDWFLFHFFTTYITLILFKLPVSISKSPRISSSNHFRLLF